MSLEISLWNDEEEEIMSLNWLRNPFGLGAWAEKNVGAAVKLPKNRRLLYVCNNWNYENANKIDRQQFKYVIDAYWVEIQKLEAGYFVFNLPEYVQLVEGKIGRVLKFHSKKSEDYMYRNNHTEIAIKMELFKNAPSLNGYKEWFYYLVLFAKKLQDPNVTFHCTN